MKGDNALSTVWWLPWVRLGGESPILKRAAALFGEALTVREVAATLRISKSEAGGLRVRALNDGLLVESCFTMRCAHIWEKDAPLQRAVQRSGAIVT
jgi:hypothetical protein